MRISEGNKSGVTKLEHVVPCQAITAAEYNMLIDKAKRGSVALTISCGIIGWHLVEIFSFFM